MYQLIKSGSTGNSIIYHNSIMVDCGVSYASLKAVHKSLKIVLLTHIHGDHINVKTLKTLQSNRPTLRIGCCEWMLPKLKGLKNIDVYEIGLIYNYGEFKLSPVKLYHDVPNCGYRIFKGEHKTFHATDTGHLDGISAKGYDTYAIEHNYDSEKAQKAIELAEISGDFCHAVGSIKTHLSFGQAWNFIADNKKPDSITVKLHQSQKYS
jgi:phosphoribosyl 1,2-cyclic phosphodiesterase